MLELNKKEKNPLKRWSQWLSLSMKERSLWRVPRKYKFSSTNVQMPWESSFSTIHLIKFCGVEEKKNPVEILFRFCRNSGDVKRIRQCPQNLMELLQVKDNDNSVDELLKDVIYALEKEKTILAAERRKAAKEHRHPRALLTTRL